MATQSADYTMREVNMMSLAKRKALFVKARRVYYNSKTGDKLMSDKVFDYLEDLIRDEDPTWLNEQGTGAPVSKGKKLGAKVEVPLERPCASLDKVKPDDPAKLERMRARLAEYSSRAVKMPKFDGSSLIVTYDGGKPVKLCTRGDGKIGKDVTFLLPHTSLPKQIQDTWRFHLRLEAIVKVDTWREKWQSEFKGDRAMASAVFNRQDAHPALADVDLIVIRAHAPDGHEEWEISAGLKCAKRNGFKVTPHTVITTLGIDVDYLRESLGHALAKSPYRLDGLVVASDAPALAPTEDNPDYAFAFKVDSHDEAPLTKIEEIVWKISSTGKAVPKARVTPVDFDGVTVSQCALHNPRMCIDNGWGVGAQVRIIRSGEIIPKIVETVRKAKFKMPTAEDLGGAWTWDENETHIYVENVGHTGHQIRAQQFLRALEAIGVEHAAHSIAERLASAGCPDAMALISALYTDPVKAFMKAGASELMAKKIAATLPATLTMPQLMKASAMFPEGMGERRFEKLMELRINWYDHDFLRNTSITKEKMQEALGQVFGEAFFDHYEAFYRKLAKLKHIPIAKPAKRKKVAGPLSGQCVSWTGYRDANEEAAVERAGGEVVSFGSKTTILLYRADGKASSKVEKAKEKGIKVLTFNKLGL